MVARNDAAGDVSVFDYAGAVIDPAIATIYDVSEGKQSGYPAVSTSLLAEVDFTVINCCDGGASDSVCVRQSAIWQHGP